MEVRNRVEAPDGDIIEVTRSVSAYGNNIEIGTHSYNVTKSQPQRWGEMDAAKGLKYVRFSVSDNKGGASITMNVEQAKALRDFLNQFLGE